MFDALLNSKFYNKCKHAFKCIRMRLVPIRRKKEAMIRFMKKDIADLLINGLDTHAFGRMDGLIKEINHASCYDMIEQFCEFIGKQLNTLQKQRDCPQETQEAVSTLIFAAARFPDLPELCDLRHIFTERYGNFLGHFVSLEFVEKLDNTLFSNEEKLQVMQSIAEEFLVDFDTKALKIKLWAAPETKHDTIENNSGRHVELATTLSNKKNGDDDAPCGKKSEATPVGHKTKLEVSLKQNDAQPVAAGIAVLHENRRQHLDKSDCKEHLEKLLSDVDMKRTDTQQEVRKQDAQPVAAGIGLLHENTRRQHSDKSDCKDHLEKPVSDLDKKRNTRTEVRNANKKDVRPCGKELMEAVELDLNGLPKKGLCSVKFPETESKKEVPLTVKPKIELDVEKENDKGLRQHQRSHMPDFPVHKRGHADSGLKTLGLENQGFSSGNPSNGNAANRVPPYVKLHGAKGKSCAEKEQKNGVLNARPQHVAVMGKMQDRQRVPERAANMPDGPVHKKEHADSGLKALGLENQGFCSGKPSNGNTAIRVPPYVKLNGANGMSCVEKEEKNGVLNARPQHLADMGQMQDGQRVPEKAANMRRPPYVKPKFNMEAVNDDPAKQTASDYNKHNISEQTDHLADKDVIRPTSVRRKYTKPPAPAVAYDEVPNNGKVTGRTPSSHRRNSSKQNNAEDVYDRKGGSRQPQGGSGIDDVVNGKNVQRTPSSRPKYPVRKNGALHTNDYDRFMRHQAEEDETAIDFGNLILRPANGQQRIKGRSTDVRNGDDDEEERMMDKLLMHYSKKGLDTEIHTTPTNRTANVNGTETQSQQKGSMNPPGRAVSLPPESVCPNVKAPARSTSLQPDCPRSAHVHPKMPDFDELAARINALRKA